MSTAEGTVTPYSTVAPYVTGFPTWVGPLDQERIASYQAYQDMYWSEDTAFKLIRRNQDGRAVYVPKPKLIVDTTAYYLLKGLKIGVEDPKSSADLVEFLEAFLERERFYARFEVAKHAGCIRGDFIFHLTANPKKAEGSRISFNSVDPAAYFPEFDSDDLEKRTGAKLVEQSLHPTDPTKTVVKVLRYWHELDEEGEIIPGIWREENLWEMEGWNNPDKAKLVQNLLPMAKLPPEIPAIPLYHFKNAEFDGFDFGNSELKGYERIFQAINQAISDEEISLALTGLGVYATDAGRPKDARGVEQDWIVAPGMVWEMPGATLVKRLEGITSVTPVLDHVHYLEDALGDGTGVKAALSNIDAQTAESGIALALKFVPLLAKIESRDHAGTSILTQMWYDWKFWVKVFEGKDFTATKIVITLGDKLPLNRVKILEELNNMVDRKIISKKYYREQCTLKLGYVFPEDMEQDIIDEEKKFLEATTPAPLLANAQNPTANGVPGPGGRLQGAGDTLPKPGNQSNNRNAPNESKGTEVKA